MRHLCGRCRLPPPPQPGPLASFDRHGPSARQPRPPAGHLERPPEPQHEPPWLQNPPGRLFSMPPPAVTRNANLHLHPQNRPLLRPFCRLCLPFLFLCRNPSCPSCLLYPNLCRSRKNLYSNLSRQSSFSAPLQVHSRGQGLLSPSPSSTSRRRRQHKDPTPRSHLSLFLCRRPFLQTGPNPKHLSPNPSLPCRPCRRRCRPTTRCRRRRSRRQRAEGSAPRVAVEPLR
mmetsp:Transcript_14/g.31  ORF Transcript_14/g.31 Transcript_14/m.31 type:complete len:229 (-) Transcript_14:29-715(-)